jgi:hypothetical protein
MTAAPTAPTAPILYKFLKMPVFSGVYSHWVRMGAETWNPPP